MSSSIDVGRQRWPVGFKLAMVRLLLPLAVCCAAAALSCSRSPAPAASDILLLAQGGVPASWRSGEAQTAQFQEAPEGWVRVRTSIEPQDWTPWVWPDVYVTTLSLPGSGIAPGRESAHELHTKDQELLPEPASSLAAGPELAANLRDGRFMVLGDVLLLLDRESQYITQPLDYIAWIERDDQLGARAHIPGVTGDGFLLFPGERTNFDLPGLASTADAVLQFTAFAYGSSIDDATTTIVVERDGEVLLEKALPNRLAARGQPQRIPLPDFQGASITFRVTEGAGLALFLNPVVAPAQPKAKTQPDIVVFVADTFRADSLEPWGGAPDLAPHMNAFARESLAFLGARAPAPWTLPSHASLMTGVYPFQHQIIETSVSLPAGAPTLARSLSALGYRTAAVTDSVLVSALYGLDHGFESFLEDNRGRDFQTATLERVQTVLDADDGRPLFLFVQTYQTHTPYTPSLAIMRAHPELFGDDPDPEDWQFSKVRADWERAFLDPSGGSGPELERLGEKLRALHLGEVAELDAGFQDLLAMLDRKGLGEADFLLTSDHGESFGEHGHWQHANSVFEQQVRIPFLLRGPGIAPGERTMPVSLIDVPPTLAALAGAPMDPTWAGRDLLSAGSERVGVFSFECSPDLLPGAHDDYAVFAGDRKITGRLDGRQAIRAVVHAYDLSADDGEDSDLAGTAAAWPAELLQQWARELDEATRPGLAPSRRTMTNTELSALQAMGYLGDMELAPAGDREE